MHGLSGHGRCCCCTDNPGPKLYIFYYYECIHISLVEPNAQLIWIPVWSREMIPELKLASSDEQLSPFILIRNNDKNDSNMSAEIWKRK